MKNGEHHDSISVERVEHAIGEPACEDSTKLSMQLSIRLRIGANRFDGTLDLGEEFPPNPGSCSSYHRNA
jgi:hypothetical protein